VIMAVNEIFDTKFEVCGENQWWLIK
jgi:hypothetical protein